MIRHAVVAVMALASGGAIAHFHVAAQEYQPIIRVRTPDRVTYTATLDPVRDRLACGVASERFVSTIAADCPDCRVLFARCRREGEGLPASVRDEASQDSSVLEMPGVTISINAAPDTARHMCESVADTVTRLGVQSARCRHAGDATAERVSVLPHG